MALALLAGGWGLGAADVVPAPAAPQPRLGMNLAGPADWSTELPFVDVFRLSRPWISQRQGQPWGKGPELQLDEHGWIKALEADCWAETPLCTIDGGHYPSGRYTVLYEGQGRLEVVHAAKVAERAPGRLLIDVDATKGGFFLQVRETDPADPVRKLRVIMPGFIDTYEKDPWHPAFLQHWQGFAVLRFMDLMQTNGSEVTTWAERPQLAAATCSSKGVPLELLCDLCNRQDADAWFCMPHQADDEYVRSFARQAKELLEPGRRVYIEYSNEVWNSMFAQSRWAGEKGTALGFAEKPWEAAWRYTAFRSVQIFRIWEQEFGGRERLVRVLASQAANAYVSERIVEFQDAYTNADALAIAPYLAMNVKADEAAAVLALGLDGVFGRLREQVLPETTEWLRKQQAVARKYGLQLMAYEGGQHLVGVLGGENNNDLTALFQRVNRDPRMGQLYNAYLDTWAALGGDLFCVFSSTSRWSKWGSWGLLEYYDEAPASQPKFTAVMEWAHRHGQKVAWPPVAPVR